MVFRARLRRMLGVAVAASLLLSGVLIGNAGAASASAVTGAGSTATSASTGTNPETGISKMADLSKFQPGYIISDAAFFNSSSMSEAQVQAFLEARVPNCQSGYTCLKDWYDTSRSVNADAMCGAYSGGYRERASRIIYRVAQACGINPQVILATLQKEQGLVTHTWPSDWRYTIAMGQGCPDTAACDTRYYGFFNQVYGAAWQFKRYANPPGTSNYFNWYAPGRTWSILYNPNRDCGSSPVFVQNQATANLYYYTPYQPNAAALRAGYGTGDGCSSYGNRNFFNYFNDWFGGQPDPAAEIEAEYAAQGGVAGLGSPTSDVMKLTKNGGGYARAYVSGSVYWSPSTGAKTVRSGPMRDYYFANGGADGALGWPAHNQQGVTRGSTQGVAQAFTGGSVYAGPSGTFVVREPMLTRYFAYSGAAGALGWPLIEQVCYETGCRQNFEGGVIVSSSAGAFGVLPPVLAAFDAAGGVTGAWGVPVMDAAAVSANGGGLGQAFVKGSAYSRTGGAAFFVSGGVRDYYFSVGGAAGRLGFPVAAAQCASGTSCQQQFQAGWILWTAAGGGRIGDPAIDAAYAAAGGPSGVLGARTGSFVQYGYNGGGFAEAFANGAIFYKPALGAAYPVSGAVRDAYFANGGAAGRFGWPTSTMTCSSGTCQQNFEGGTISVAGS